VDWDQLRLCVAKTGVDDLLLLDPLEHHCPLTLSNYTAWRRLWHSYCVYQWSERASRAWPVRQRERGGNIRTDPRTPTAASRRPVWCKRKHWYVTGAKWSCLGCKFESRPGPLRTMVYSAFIPSGVGHWVPAVAGKAKAGMAHSACGWNAGSAGKLWYPLTMRAIPERLRVVSCIGPIQINITFTFTLPLLDWMHW